MTGRRRSLAWALALALLPGGAGGQQADAYADDVARQLVERARARRGIIDLSITEYRTLSRERISVGYRLLRRDRLLFRRETAARVHWRREGATEIEVLGAREVMPVAQGRPQVPGDLTEFMPHIAFDPLDSEFLFRMDTTFVRNPLAEGAERYYRYAAGDSSVVRLPDGSEVRLRELRITPRERDPHLIAGSFWIHSGSYAVVQAAFRLARGYSVAEDEDNSAVARALFGGVRADFSHFAVDYGLWDLQWWLPRSLVVEGVLELGALGTMPMQYERSYTEYEVVADTSRRNLHAAADTLLLQCRRAMRFAMSINVGGGTDTTTTSRARERARERQRERVEALPDSIAERCRARFIVTVPDSVQDLLTSDLLPPSIYGESTVLAEHELEQLAARVRDLPLPAWQLAGGRLQWGPGGAGLLRYNRVEGLGLGARALVDFGRARGELELGYGVADEWPKAAARLAFAGPARTLTFSGYRELHATDEGMRPGALTGSVNALLFGRDDLLLYRAAGADVRLRPAPARPQWYALRLYAERQSATRKNTDFSVPHLFDDSHEFRANIAADRATQYGAEARLRAEHGVDPAALRLAAQLDVRGETGTFAFVRPALTLRATLPPLGPFGLGVEAAGGTTFETSPVQSWWHLGGTPTLRGYAAGVLAGPAFWRARAELGTALPLVRLALFADAGWAGAAEGDAWRRAQPLLSAGAGLSLLDGVVRLDLARALRAPTGWRLHLYLDGVL